MDWVERIAEEKIRKAAEAGVFRRNKYFGKPVPLEPENPHLPREWWAAFHLLKIHDLAPLWILRYRWIRQAVAAWRNELAYVLTRSPQGDITTHEALERLRERMHRLNEHIREYNWNIPRSATPLPPLDWNEECARVWKE